MADNVDNMKYWRGHGSAEDKYYEQGGRNKPGPKRLLSPWLEFLMTLIWMRLALPHQLLSDLFGVGTSTVQRIVITWVMAMNTVLVPVFLPWPSRETVDEYMPEKFKKYFPRTRVIIDCTELYIQRPRDPDAQHKTYSSYKSWNTLKLLIGISPVGNITFVSKAWSGNSSDKFVTKNSGLLDIIEPFDHVMADRGFQIEDLLLPHGAKLIAPPFTRKCDYGKGKRLNAAEIIQTRNIALLRIHVERAIERMKRWEILHRLPNRSVSFASELASVIAGLCNLLPPLVEDWVVVFTSGVFGLAPGRFRWNFHVNFSDRWLTLVLWILMTWHCCPRSSAVTRVGSYLQNDIHSSLYAGGSKQVANDPFLMGVIF